MAKKLFVGGLSWNTTNDTLRDFFAQIGEVVSSDVRTYPDTGKSRGFGFVEMANDEDAQRAIDELNGKELDGRAIAVNEARPPQPRENRSFGGGGYGGGGRRDHRDRGDRGGNRGY